MVSGWIDGGVLAVGWVHGCLKVVIIRLKANLVKLNLPTGNEPGTTLTSVEPQNNLKSNLTTFGFYTYITLYHPNRDSTPDQGRDKID